MNKGETIGAIAGGVTGGAAGIGGATAAVSAAGSVSGLSAAGFTSGLAALGGGSMMTGAVVATGGVAVIAVGCAIAGVWISRKLTGKG